MTPGLLRGNCYPTSYFKIMYHCVIPQLKRDVGRTRDPLSERILNAYEKPERPSTSIDSIRNSSGFSATIKSARKVQPLLKHGAPSSTPKVPRTATLARQPDRDPQRNKASQPTATPRGSSDDRYHKVIRLPTRVESLVLRFRKSHPEVIRPWMRRPARRTSDLFPRLRRVGSIASCWKRKRYLLRRCCQEFSRLYLERYQLRNCAEWSAQYMNDVSLFRIRWERKTRKAFQTLLSNREDCVLWKPRSEEDCHSMWTKWDTLDDLTPFRKQLKDIGPVVTLENFVDCLLEFPFPREWRSKEEIALPADFWLSTATSRNTTGDSMREVFAELSPMYNNYQVSYFEKDYKSLTTKKERPLLRSLRRRDILQVTRLCRLGCTANLRAPTWSLLLRDKTHEKREYQDLFRSFLRYESFSDWMSFFSVSESVGNSDQFFNFVSQTQQVLLIFLRDNIRRTADPEKDTPWSRKPEEFHQMSLPFHEFPMYVAPLAYVCLQTSPAYFMFRELYRRYFHLLHEISTHPQSILSLYRLFENLLYAKEPLIWEHLRVTLGFHPGAHVMPWIIMAFSGYMEIDQLLLLWDRIIGYNDLRILTLLSLGIFISRGKVLLKCSTCRDVGVVLSDIFNIQVVPLLQLALFS